MENIDVDLTDAQVFNHLADALAPSSMREQEEKRKELERDGDVVEGGSIMATNFPKNPPPPGMAYSKNFARAQQSGRFAVQVKD